MVSCSWPIPTSERTTFCLYLLLKKKKEEKWRVPVSALHFLRQTGGRVSGCLLEQSTWVMKTMRGGRSCFEARQSSPWKQRTRVPTFTSHLTEIKKRGGGRVDSFSCLSQTSSHSITTCQHLPASDLLTTRTICSRCAHVSPSFPRSFPSDGHRLRRPHGPCHVTSQPATVLFCNILT